MHGQRPRVVTPVGSLCLLVPVNSQSLLYSYFVRFSQLQHENILADSTLSWDTDPNLTNNLCVLANTPSLAIRSGRGRILA